MYKDTIMRISIYDQQQKDYLVSLASKHKSTSQVIRDLIQQHMDSNLKTTISQSAEQTYEATLKNTLR